ncbi:MAG: hypothetical protein ACOC6F_02620 [bacterium]
MSETSFRRVAGSHCTLRQMTSGATLCLVLLAIYLNWMLPAAEVLMATFRPYSGTMSFRWWTPFETLFDFTQWTLEHYRRVITEEGVDHAFLNSFIVSIASTVIPVMAVQSCKKKRRVVHFR